MAKSLPCRLIPSTSLHQIIPFDCPGHACLFSNHQMQLNTPQSSSLLPTTNYQLPSAWFARTLPYAFPSPTHHHLPTHHTIPSKTSTATFSCMIVLCPPIPLPKGCLFPPSFLLPHPLNSHWPSLQPIYRLQQLPFLHLVLLL